MRRLLALLFILAVAATGAAMVAVAPPAGAQLPPDDPSRGLIYSGLRRGGPGSPCEGSFEVVSRGRSGDERVRCTHGPDPVPAGVDPRPGQDPGFRAAETAPAIGGAGAVAPGLACYGDGTDGNRVQLMYAREATSPDRYPTFEATFRDWAARIDDVYNTSAAETGGIRHVRYVTDGQCRPVITRLVVSAAAVDSFATLNQELDDAGFDHRDRKYLVWVDTQKTTYCGQGEIWQDIRADPTPGVNSNNGGTALGLHAGVYTRCWGQANMAEAHELMHMLGGVQPSRAFPANAPPHATSNFHCTDESDRLCYADGDPAGNAVTGPVYKPDGTATALQYVCPASHEALLDCNHDDYFSTNPPPGNWLASHWNTANSAWLEKAPPPGTPTSAASGSAWYDDGTTARSGPAGTTVSVYATGLFPNVPYLLVTGRDGGTPSQPCRADLMAVNTTLRYATSSGFLGSTAGVVNRLPGTYQLCFAQIDPVVGPRAVSGVVSFTVGP